MKVLPLTLGPIVGATTPTSVRLFGRAGLELTTSGPRRAFGVARLKPRRGKFRKPLFFKMNPNFDMTGVVVFDSLEANSVHEYQIGYIFSDAELENLEAAFPLEWKEANRSAFRTAIDDEQTSRSYVLGSCRYLLRLFGGAWFDTRGDKVFDSIRRQIEEGTATDGLIWTGDQIYADDLSVLFPDRLPDEFLKRYRDAFGQPAIRELMGRVPTYMTLDDHEIEEGWPKYAHPSDYRVKYPAAMHAYQIYQASHSPLFEVSGCRIDGIPERLWYRFRDGCCDFFVMDVRTERIIEGDRGNLRMVSPTQMEALKSWLADGSGRVKLVVTSVPLFPETSGKEDDHWMGFPSDRDELVAHIVENRVEKVVFLSGDAHASMTAELRGIEGTRAKLISIVSSPLFWPYPEAPARTFTLEGTLRAGTHLFELAEGGPVHRADNFTRVTVHPDRVEAAVYSRKGDLLPPVKVHRF